MPIIILFFSVLAFFIGGAAMAQKQGTRVASALAAFGWGCLMFSAVSWAESFSYNLWYSTAASKMLDAYISGIEQGRQEAVLTEMRRMAKELEVTYERKGNFKELAERATASLVPPSDKPDDAVNEHQPTRPATEQK